MEELLTREETAQFLQISTRTLDRYVRKKILKPRKDGRRTVFRRVEVEALAETPGEQPHIVSESKSKETSPDTPDKNILALANLAQEMHRELKEKDEQIANLNYELGKYQEMSKNSIPLLAMEQKERNDQEKLTNVRSELHEAKTWRSVYLVLFGISLAVIGIILNYFLSNS